MMTGGENCSPFADVMLKVKALHCKALREVLKEFQLTASGTKSTLINRLRKAFTSWFNEHDVSKCSAFGLKIDRLYDTQTNPDRLATGPAPPAAQHVQPSYSQPNRPTPDPSQPAANCEIIFRETPFFDIISTLLPPTSIDVVGRNGKELAFYLGHEYLERIRQQATDTSTNPKLKVLLRVCPLVQGQTLQCPDQFPDHLLLILNRRRQVYSIPPTAANQQLALRKVSDNPKDVTRFCAKGSPRNKLKLATTSELPYMGGIYLANYKTPKFLAEEVMKERLTSPAKSQKEWQAKLAADYDKDIAALSTSLSLLCPVSKCRLTKPARGLNCEHLQCFDLLSYLSINERRPSWRCPVCHAPLGYADLVVDGYFFDIVSKAPPTATEIQLDPKTAEWATPPTSRDLPVKRPVSPELVVCSNQPKRNKIVVDLTADIESESDAEKSSANSLPAGSLLISMKTELGHAYPDASSPNNQSSGTSTMTNSQLNQLKAFQWAVGLTNSESNISTCSSQSTDSDKSESELNRSASLGKCHDPICIDDE